MSQVELVLPAMVDGTTKAQMLQEAMDVRHKQLTERLGTLGFSARISVMDHDLVDRAIAAMPENGVIVVGIKGSGMLQRIFIGSTVVKRIDRTTVPVLAVPRGNHLQPPLHLFVAVAPDGTFDPVVLREMVSRLGNKAGRMTFFTMVDRSAAPGPALERLHRTRDTCGLALPAEVELLEGEAGLSALKGHIADHPNALLVLDRGGRELMDQLFRRFFINELVHEGHVPLLVLP